MPKETSVLSSSKAIAEAALQDETIKMYNDWSNYNVAPNPNDLQRHVVETIWSKSLPVFSLSVLCHASVTIFENEYGKIMEAMLQWLHHVQIKMTKETLNIYCNLGDMHECMLYCTKGNILMWQKLWILWDAFC